VIGPPDNPLCPSARPEMQGSVVFGVVGGTVDEPRVGYLRRSLPVTQELLRMTDPAEPTEVLRFAAPCARHQCLHFDGADCSLARRTVQLIAPVVDRLPPCPIRRDCLWFAQEGQSACLRCPQVVTDSYQATDEYRRAATPEPVRK
jgi:hypothetical protein